MTTTPEQSLLENLNQLLDAQPSHLDKLAEEEQTEDSATEKAEESTEKDDSEESAEESASDESTQEVEKHAQADQLRDLMESTDFCLGVTDRIEEREPELATAVSSAYDRIHTD